MVAKPTEFTQTMIGYNNGHALPDIDTLLDWRNRLVELRDKDNEYPALWYNNEIKATDYLLSLHK